MECGIVGLGRMGSGVAKRLLTAGHRVVAYNRSPEKTAELASQGAVAADTMQTLVQGLSSPRVVWMYLPAGEVTSSHAEQLLELLSSGDTLIDGGNSQFNASKQLAEKCAAKGVRFLDVGTSGGIAGADEGYCLMIGGEKETYESLSPLWEAVACSGGVALAGPVGSGHFTKMVHNAIEYGMMQAYAEGMALLEHASFTGKVDVPAVTELWQHGSIIRSYLGGLVAQAASAPDLLAGASAKVAHSGEGLWAVQEGLEHSLALPVMTAALYTRFASQDEAATTEKYLSAMRYLFGGHNLK